MDKAFYDRGVHAGSERRARAKEGSLEVATARDDHFLYREAIVEAMRVKPAKFLSSLIRECNFGGEFYFPTKRQLVVLNTFREQRNLPAICCRTREKDPKAALSKRNEARNASVNASYSALAASRPMKPPGRAR